MKRLIALLLLIAAPVFAQSAPVLTAITAVHLDARQRQVPTPTAPTITLPKATDATISLTVRNSDNTRTSISGAAITFTMRKAVGDASALISRLATLTDAVNGVAAFSIAQSDTSALATGDYVYSIEAVWLGGAREQLVKVSPLKLVPTVGQPSDTPTTPEPEAVVAYGLPAVGSGEVNKYLKATGYNPTTLAWASGGGGGGGDVSIATTSPLTGGTTGSDFALACPTCLTSSAIGSTVQGFDADLAALAGLSSTAGMLARTGSGAFTPRTITGSGGITVTNGDGASGAPAISIADGALGNAKLASSSIATSTSGGISASASVALGGTLSLSCPTCVLTTGDQTIAGNKTFSSSVLAPGMTAAPGGPGYLRFVDAGVATGDYETNQTGFRFAMGNEVTVPVNLMEWRAKLYYPGATETRWAALVATTATIYLELSHNGNYSASLGASYTGGAPQLVVGRAWKMFPEFDGTQCSSGGFHCGTMNGGAAVAGEMDGDKRWRAVGALLHEGPTATLSTSGAVTWQPVTSGEQAVIVSSGNVTAITISLPTDAYSPRVIDAFHARLILKQGNASHTWASSITNAVLPAGIVPKQSLGLNEYDVIDCTYYYGDSKYLCDVRSLGATPTWAPYDSDLAALAGASSTGLWARTGAGTGAPRTITEGTGIDVANGNGVSGNPTVTLENTAVSPGTYGDATHSARVTIDQQGRITSASSVSISGAGGGGGTTSNALTIGTGLDGTSFDGSAPVTIALSTGAALANLASASVTNAKLATPSTTVNGQTCTLGSTCTVTATATNALTAGTGLSGSSFDGSTARAWTVDQTFSPSWSGAHDYASGVLKLPAGTTPAQTADASIFWDSDDDLLTVGTGAARKTMLDTTAAAAAYQPLDADLTAVAALASTAGMVSRTGAGAFAVRTLVCANSECTWTNGDGSAGAPSLAIAYGTTSHTATQGNDTRLPPAPSGAGKVPYDNGSAYVAASAGASATVFAGGTAPAFTATPTVTTITGSTSVLTPLLDAASSGALNIGTTTATSIALKQNTTLPTAKTLVVGSNTLVGSVADKLNAAHLAIASQAAGDTLYADTTTSFARLGIGGAGTFQRSSGTAPAWSAWTLPASVAAGDLLYGSATNVASALAVGTAGRALAVNQAGTAPAWGHFIDAQLSCTSSTTGGAAVDCDILTLPSGLGSSNTKSFRGMLSLRLTTNGAGGGTVALTCGTSHGGTDVLTSQTITAGTTGAGTWYGDKGDGSELGTKADSTRSYNLFVDGGSTVSCRLGAPSGTVSSAVVVQGLLSGATL